VRLQPNIWDATRAHLAVLNFSNRSNVMWNAGEFLKFGESYRVHAPSQLYGEPVLTGTYDGKPIRIPLNGPLTAFVAFKTLETSPGSVQKPAAGSP
jgi:hypothetical protein